MEKKLTFAEAKEMSIKKWTDIVQTGRSAQLCGFCELDTQKLEENLDSMDDDCDLCEFRIACGGYPCDHEKNPHSIWKYDKTTENAQKVLDAVLRTEETK